jgi:hypothetical protein
MVKDSARKKAARAYAQATGVPYTTAARRTSCNGSELSTADVYTALMEALQAAGWPVESETFPENVEYRGYAGPARLTVGRAYQVYSFGLDDPDPDDGDRLDLSQPPRVEMGAPLIEEGFEVHSEVNGDRPVAEMLAEMVRMVTDGRARAVAELADHRACAICGDLYPAEHLLAAAGSDRLLLCPACAFDGDVFQTVGHASALLAYQLDRLVAEDLAIPAGWAGPAALLACAAAPGFGARLHKVWRQAGTLFDPADRWSHPEQIWVWLPPVGRPAPLDRFGPGARLGALVTALDEHLPGLRQRARERDAEDWRQAGLSDDQPVPDRFLDQVWPAVVAYAIGLYTQAVERPTCRPPLQHLLGSFDTLRDHLDLVDSPLDYDDVEPTLHVGIEVLTETLWPHDSRAATS